MNILTAVIKYTQPDPMSFSTIYNCWLTIQRDQNAIIRLGRFKLNDIELARSPTKHTIPFMVNEIEFYDNMARKYNIHSDEYDQFLNSVIEELKYERKLTPPFKIEVTDEIMFEFLL